MAAIGIIDYGMSNLDSVQRAIVECGGDPFVITERADFGEAAALILPGVGSYAAGMSGLESRNFIEPLVAEVQRNSIPILGICLGMQLLATRGLEGSSDGDAGLGWIDGNVTRLPSTDRVPHVGWNEVNPVKTHPEASTMFEGLTPARDFYFVHSYRFVPADDSAAVATTPYSGGFCSAVACEHVWGVQFHPEKSQRAGFRILRNFLGSI